MLEFKVFNTKEGPSRLGGFFRFSPEKGEISKELLPSQRTVCGHFKMWSRVFFEDLYKERPELFAWFKENAEGYLKKPEYGMWSEEPWILTDKIVDYIELEGSVRHCENESIVNFDWTYGSKSDFMFALMILIQNGYYNIAIRDPRQAEFFKEDILEMFNPDIFGVFYEIEEEFGEEDEEETPAPWSVRLEYEAHWYDRLWDFAAFDPSVIRPCKGYEDYVSHIDKSLIDGQWLLISNDTLWNNFAGPLYVPDGVIQSGMSKEEIWESTRSYKGWVLPLQFESKEAAVECVKNRFQSFNEAQVKAGYTNEILHFTQRVISEDLICLDAPHGLGKHWVSVPYMEDCLDIIDLFAIRITERTRKQVSDYLLYWRDKKAITFFGTD